MPIRYYTGEYSYDLLYDSIDMSASMGILKERLNALLKPYFNSLNLRWKDAYFVWFTKCGGDAGWMFCVGPLEFHIDGTLRRYYSGKTEIVYDHKDRYFLMGEKKKSICNTCKGFGFIRDETWGYLNQCEKCGASHE